MSDTQTKIEELLAARQMARKPRLEYSLAKLRKKLENKERYIANAEMRARRKVDAMERMVISYQADLKCCEEGTYHGANGLPFGAIPGLDLGGIG